MSVSREGQRKRERDGEKESGAGSVLSVESSLGLGA